MAAGSKAAISTGGSGRRNNNPNSATTDTPSTTSPERPNAHEARRRIGSSTTRYDTYATTTDTATRTPNSGSPSSPVRCGDRIV